MSIRVNQESGTPFVLPLTRVDVIYTQRGGEGGDSSITLLQDMLVLAADMETSRSPDQPAKISQTVTLAVKPDEAQKLALATARGELRLTLRRSDDKETPQTRKTTPRDVDRGSTDGEPEGPGGVAAEDKSTGPKPTLTIPEPVAEKKSEPEEKKEPTIESDPDLFWVQEVWNGEGLTKVIRKKSGSGEGAVKVEKSDSRGTAETPRKPETKSTDKPQEIKVDKE
jgi:Flp pilus assembly protein CpaB